MEENIATETGKSNRKTLERYAPHLSALAVAIAILIILSLPLVLHISGDIWGSLLIWMAVAYLSFAILRRKMFSRGGVASALGVFVGFLIALGMLSSFFVMEGRCYGSGCEEPLWKEPFKWTVSFISVPLLSFYFGKWGMMREEKKASRGKRWGLLALFSFLGYSAFSIFFIMGLFAYLYEYSLFQILYEKSEHFRRFNYTSFAIVFAISYVFWAPFFLLDNGFIVSRSPDWLYPIFYSAVSIIPFLFALGTFRASVHSPKINRCLLWLAFPFSGYFMLILLAILPPSIPRPEGVAITAFIAFACEYSLFHLLYKEFRSFRDFSHAGFVLALLMFILPLLVLADLFTDYFLNYPLIYFLVTVIPFLVAFALFAIRLHLKKGEIENSQ